MSSVGLPVTYLSQSSYVLLEVGTTRSLPPNNIPNEDAHMLHIKCTLND